MWTTVLDDSYINLIASRTLLNFHLALKGFSCATRYSNWALPLQKHGLRSELWCGILWSRKLRFARKGNIVRLQITTGGDRTKHGQAMRTEFIEEFILFAWTSFVYEFLNQIRTDCFTMFCSITPCCYLQSNIARLWVYWQSFFPRRKGWSIIMQKF